MRTTLCFLFCATLVACSSNDSPGPTCGSKVDPCPPPRGSGGSSSGSPTGGGSSSSGGGGAATGGGGGTTSDVKCETDGTTCVCNHDADTNVNTSTCSEASSGLCCAGSGWPSSDECVCAPVQCTTDGLGDCNCGFGASGTPVGSSCPTPNDGVCCMTEGAFGSELCICTDGSHGCGTGETQVDSCSASAIGCTGDATEASSCH